MSREAEWEKVRLKRMSVARERENEEGPNASELVSERSAWRHVRGGLQGELRSE